MKMSYRDHIAIQEVLKRAKAQKLEDIVTERRSRMAGHVFRLPNQHPAKIASKGHPKGGKRKKEERK